MKKRTRKRRGSVLVEMALVVPLLTVLFLGAWQFGNAFWLYSELENGVRAGGRYASNRTYESSTATPTSDWIDGVKSTVVYGDAYIRSGTPIVRNLTPENVTVDILDFAVANKPARVRVCITGYDVGFFSPIVLANKPCAEFPYVGIFAPVS